MAPESTALTTKVEAGSPYQLDPSQTLRAATELLKKIQAEDALRKTDTGKADLLADEESSDAEAEDATPVWLVLTTKKHIVDKKSLKPGKIALPHPLHSATSPNLRICLITADPQRKYKDIVANPAFPLTLSSKIARVIGMEKLKAKYKSYESRRQLLSEYDIFLADDRIVIHLPGTLGKIFYGGGSKRPIPVSLEGRKENTTQENGAKRLKLSEGGKKVTKAEPTPKDIASDIERAIGSALVHLSPSVTTAVKVGKSGMSGDQLSKNVETVVAGMVQRYIPKGWRNIRSIHIKGPNTVSLPIWLASELWVDDEDVLEKPIEFKNTKDGKKKQKKRKRALLTEGAVEAPITNGAVAEKRKSTDGEENPKKKRKSEGGDDEKVARKEALKQQKEAARAAI